MPLHSKKVGGCGICGRAYVVWCKRRAEYGSGRTALRRLKQVGGKLVAERYRVEWTYEGSSMASYGTFDLVGAERYQARVMEDPIAEDVRIVEAEPE